MNQKFEWDENKNNDNRRKHKISFEMASRVFDDINRVEYFDASHSCNEDRYITIGSIGAIIMVVYTERKDTLRIISARHATRKEKEVYYDANGNLH